MERTLTFASIFLFAPFLAGSTGAVVQNISSFQRLNAIGGIKLGICATMKNLTKNVVGD